MSVRMVEEGRATLAHIVKSKEIFLGLGEGEIDWEEGRKVEGNPKELVNLLAYQRLLRSYFVLPDENGEIPIVTRINDDGTVEEQRYSQVEHSTPFLYVEFRLHHSNLVSKTIREAGIFIDAKVKEGVGKGVMHLKPDDLEEKGHILVYQIPAVFLKRTAVQENFGYVIPF